ncbi:MAG: hypothetical protein R3B09_06730 [Nannocystaceae bacterium]
MVVTREGVVRWGKRGPGALHEALRLPDGGLLTASEGGLLRWDLEHGDLRATWTREPMVALTLSPDGQRVAAADARGRVHLFDRSGQAIAGWRRPPGDDDVLLRWDALLIVCSIEGLWGCDPLTGAIRETWDAGSTWMLAAAGGRVLHGSNAGALRFTSGRVKGEKVRGGAVTAVALAADGRAAVAVGRGLRTYDAALRETGRRALSKAAVALDLRPDGRLVVGLEGGRISIDGAAPRELPGTSTRRGDASGWRGDASGWRGDASGWRGDASGWRGDASGWRFDRDGRQLTLWSDYHGLAEVHDLHDGAALGHVGGFGEASVVVEVTPTTQLVLTLHGDGQRTWESGTLFETASGRCLWRGALGRPQGLIDVDRSRGRVFALEEVLVVIDGSTGATTRLHSLLSEDDVALSLSVRRGALVVELEGRDLKVDLDTLTTTSRRRRGG